MKMEEEIIEFIREEGDGDYCDITDYGLAWSYWDDNETEHRSDNVDFTLNIIGLEIETDCNGCETVIVYFDDDSSKSWGQIDFDDDGYNMAEYIYFSLI